MPLSFVKITALCLGLASTGAWARPLAEVKKSGKLNLCFVKWSSAADNSDNRNGPDYEIAVAFAKGIGVKVVPKEIIGIQLFANAKGEVDKGATEPELLANGTCDFYAANITINDWRLRKIDIVSVYPGKTMIMIRTAEKEHYKALADLGDKTTIYREGTTYQTWVEDQNKSVLKDHPIKAEIVKTSVPVKHLVEKRVDFMMYDTLIALYLIGHYKNQIQMSFPVGPNELLGWGFRKSDKSLSEAVTKFLDAERANANSEMNRIFKDYFQVTVKDYEDIVYSSQSVEK